MRVACGTGVRGAGCKAARLQGPDCILQAARLQAGSAALQVAELLAASVQAASCRLQGAKGGLAQLTVRKRCVLAF